MKKSSMIITAQQIDSSDGLTPAADLRRWADQISMNTFNKSLIIAWIAVCITASIWSINLAFEGIDPRASPEEIENQFERPWRAWFRIGLASIITVGSLTSICYLAIRARNWNE
jgi:hypothetical protein